MKRRVLCLLFVSVMVFGMAGCGGNSEEPSESPELSGTESTDQSTSGSTDGSEPGQDVTVPRDSETEDGSQEAEQQAEPVKTEVSIDITDFYQTHVGDPSNFYFIDENNVLWGSGRNQCGQLGLETQDYDFHDEAVKIAENVIDVDYSQTGFVIFLTEDNKLYGLGNAGCGALQQYPTFDDKRYVNGEHYYIVEPYLLMEDVRYARCGMSDVACLAQDGTVWVWGTLWHYTFSLGLEPQHSAAYIEKPQKVLDDAVLITGGWLNHAVLLRDGTVWTWGYNIVGNCGVEAPEYISEPVKVAEDVDMVWTDRALPNLPQPTEDDIAMALRGELTYRMDYEDISEFDKIYPLMLHNTVIRKTDGTYLACGENIGTEEKTVHGIEADYPAIYTYEFTPCK